MQAKARGSRYPRARRASMLALALLAAALPMVMLASCGDERAPGGEDRAGPPTRPDTMPVTPRPLKPDTSADATPTSTTTQGGQQPLGTCTYQGEIKSSSMTEQECHRRFPGGTWQADTAAFLLDTRDR